MCVPYSIYEAGREVFVQNLISNPSIGEFNLQKFNQDLCSWLSLQSQHFKVFFSTYNYLGQVGYFLHFDLNHNEKDYKNYDDDKDHYHEQE